jgi:hypothetical protein
MMVKAAMVRFGLQMYIEYKNFRKFKYHKDFYQSLIAPVQAAMHL